MDYATLSLAEVKAGLEDVARDAQATFGGLDSLQLNWRPGRGQWSVAQCFDHLLKSNHMMFAAAEQAMNGSAPRTVWQRLPVLPGLLGRMLIRSQAPDSSRKFKTTPRAEPATSDMPPDVIQRFLEQHRDAVVRFQGLDERVAAGAIMTSPFIRIITYSVLDGWRLIFAHDRRHVEQARRVTQSAGFPGASSPTR